MSGTIEGGRQASATMLALDPLHYHKIGALGGKAPTKKPKGFAAMSYEKRRDAGIKGGKASRKPKYV